jgi:hypothetical protein
VRATDGSTGRSDVDYKGERGMTDGSGSWRKSLGNFFQQTVVQAAGALLAAAILAGIAYAIHSHSDGGHSSDTHSASGVRQADASQVAAERATTAQVAAARSLAEQQAAEKRHGVQAKNQGQLYSFIHAAMEQPVNCVANEHLPDHVIAQQVCHFGSTDAAFTRLNSVASTQTYFRMRYLNSFSFEGAAGEHCGSGPYGLGGEWTDSHGVAQGSWSFRTSGPDVIMLWEYRTHRIVVRASQRANEVNQLCELWYRHSGVVL